tara:strand:- start:618 stop:812 length:195 start_codon:yes stop_codon:yes gene_type:complete
MTNKNKIILGVVAIGVVTYLYVNRDKKIIPGKLYKTDIGFKKEIDGEKYLKKDTRTDENKKKRS